MSADGTAGLVGCEWALARQSILRPRVATRLKHVGFLVQRPDLLLTFTSRRGPISPSVREATLPGSPVPPGTLKIEESSLLELFRGCRSLDRLCAPLARLIRCQESSCLKPKRFYANRAFGLATAYRFFIKVHGEGSPAVVLRPPCAARMKGMAFIPGLKLLGFLP